MNKRMPADDMIAVIVFMAMLVITFLNVIMRYFFHASFSFTEEIVTHAAVLLSGLGASQAIRDESHYNIPLLEGLLPARVQKAFDIVSNILTLLFCGLMTVLGVMMVRQQFSMGTVSLNMRIPEWIYGACVPIGCAFMSFRCVQVSIRIYRKLKGRQSGDEGGQEGGAEE